MTIFMPSSVRLPVLKNRCAYLACVAHMRMRQEQANETACLADLFTSLYALLEFEEWDRSIVYNFSALFAVFPDSCNPATSVIHDTGRSIRMLQREDTHNQLFIATYRNISGSRLDKVS